MIDAYSDRSLNFATAYNRLARVVGASVPSVSPQPSRRRVAKGDELNCRGAGVILSGWACQHHTTQAGERHIFGVLLPGDVVLTGRDGPGAMSQVSALSPLEVADIDAPEALDGVVSSAERRLTEARYLDQMVRLGGLSALRATAHLLLELHDRLGSVGLARNGRFYMPIGQRVIASILGLSAVHVNRTLQQLSREKTVAGGAGWMAIGDRAALIELIACTSAFGRLAAQRGLLADNVTAPAAAVPAPIRKVS